MDLRQLRYFVAVARSRSFIGASRLLHISQPALGYQIKRLEEALKVDLFSRHSRGVTLTQAGVELLEHAEAILDRLRSAEEAIKPFQRKLMGQLSLGVTPTSGRVLVPEILDTCAERTNLKIVVQQGMSDGLFRRIEAGALDVALCYETPGMERAKTIKLYREKLFLVGPPDVLGSARPIRFRELERVPLLLEDRSHVIRRLIESIARDRNIKLDVALEIEPVNLKREMVVHHRYCTIVPYGLFLEEIKSGQLGAREIRNPMLTQSLRLIFRRQLNETLGKFMLSVIRDAVAKKIAEGMLGWKPAAPRRVARRR